MAAGAAWAGPVACLVARLVRARPYVGRQVCWAGAAAGMRRGAARSGKRTAVGLRLSMKRGSRGCVYS
nr:hypothetical protein RVX_2811 [Nitratidesulfovibrio sp. HK-II]